MQTAAETKEHANTAENLKATAEDMAETAKESVKDSLEHAHETLDRVSAQANKEIQKVSEQTSTFVRENPGMAIAGAVGVGILVGLALRQR